MSRINIETNMPEFSMPAVTAEYMMCLCADYRIVPIEKLTIGDNRNISIETDEFLPVTISNTVIRLPGDFKDHIDNLIDNILSRTKQDDIIFHIIYGRESKLNKEIHDIEKCVEMKLSGIHSFKISDKSSYLRLIFLKHRIHLIENTESIHKVIHNLPQW